MCVFYTEDSEYHIAEVLRFLWIQGKYFILKMVNTDHMSEMISLSVHWVRWGIGMSAPLL